ncbi:hypothetical protein E2562_019977 [Oryza meyeriana var. granulata]|uniref:Uncharacterized protein n=1 Tax=Oryza meyeriana var. granulata TaxID=110450 RepID=A0A6G1CIB1_9ORYZ|nr:hypothetical protein E2562_019975 [Oryza meyeriana var. granulata]KAF0899494.1 hypothetical protein E2562_019977 [Oryza meyeriana var. granulata]
MACGFGGARESSGSAHQSGVACVHRVAAGPGLQVDRPGGWLAGLAWAEWAERPGGPAGWARDGG